MHDLEGDEVFGVQDGGNLLKDPSARKLRFSVTGYPAVFMECLAMIWEGLAAQKCPRNSTKTYIMLRN